VSPRSRRTHSPVHEGHSVLTPAEPVGWVTCRGLSDELYGDDKSPVRSARLTNIAPSSNGQGIALISRKLGFNSPWSHQASIAQRREHLPTEQGAGGSSPSRGTRNASVAQLERAPASGAGGSGVRVSSGVHDDDETNSAR
jgi:hypothetical protein